MRRFEFNKTMVESPLPPKDKNVLWVDINESTGKLASIKEFISGTWRALVGRSVSDIVS